MAPYLYSLALEAHNTGIPMLRALLLEFPDDYTVRQVGMEYMLGGNILVAPVFDQDDLRVYLPQGEWASLLTGEFTSGGRWVRPEVSLENIPLYLRENTAVPLRSQDVFWSEEKNYEDLTVLMNLSGQVSQVFLDDGVEYTFLARLEGGRVTLETQMPLKAVKIYCQSPIHSVCLNGRELAVKREGPTVYSAG